MCFTAAVARAHFEHRVAMVADSWEGLTRKLRAQEAEQGVVSLALSQLLS